MTLGDGLPGLDVSIPFSAEPLSHVFLVIHGAGDPYVDHQPWLSSLETCVSLLDKNYRLLASDLSRTKLRATAAQTSSTAAAAAAAATVPSAMFLPVEWHASAHVTWRDAVRKGDPRPTTSNGANSSAVAAGAPSVREAVSETVGDVLLLASPFWRAEIARHITVQMNNQLAAVRRNRPAFSGRVSVLAHSIGALLALELLQQQYLQQQRREKRKKTQKRRKQSAENSESERDQSNEQSNNGFDEALKRDHEHEHENNSDDGDAEGDNGHGKYYNGDSDDDGQEELLQCTFDAVVLAGCPAAAYAALAPDDGKMSTLEVLRRERERVRFINVFHPLDPVAYRLEPFVHPPEYKVPPAVKVRPRRRSFWNDAETFWDDVVFNLWSTLFPERDRLHQQQQQRGTTENSSGGGVADLFSRFGGNERGQARVEQRAVSKMTRNRRSSAYMVALSSGEEDGGKDDTEQQFGSEVLLSGRIDYELQDGMGVPPLDVMASWGAIKAHTYYWQSLDVAQMLLDIAVTSDDAMAKRWEERNESTSNRPLAGNRPGVRTL